MLVWCARCQPGVRGSAGLDPGAPELPGAQARPRPRHPSDGPAARSWRCGAAVRFRPAWPGRPVPGRDSGVPRSLHNGSRDPGGGVCRDALPGNHDRGRPAADGPAFRGGSRDPRGRAVAPLLGGHAAPGRPLAGGGRGAVLGARAPRARRHYHVRGQPARPHPDDADRHLRPPGKQPGACDYGLPGAVDGLPGGDDRAAGALAWGDVTLRARLALELGGLNLDVDLRAETTEIVALVGPNGAGKTTLLRALAGLVPIANGLVQLDEEVLDDTTAGIHLPPEARPVAVVFQDYLLFPHLTALDNVAYGLRSRGASRHAARQDARTWLERVGVAGQSVSRTG